MKEGEHGLYAVFGMSVDTERGSLFACSSAVPEMNGYSDADKGKAALFEFNLTNGSVRRKVTLEDPGVEHNLNDLTIDTASGDVYISDASAGGIYVLKAGGQNLQPLLAPGRLVSPQGIALSPDKKCLYVSDYPVGLYRVDLATKTLPT
ncbi:MAG: hypothetical protein IPK82_31740 [Polyangiaceae bacterium]|nr:hypothetical protein [Polyangiaceae bacterium]